MEGKKTCNNLSYCIKKLGEITFNKNELNILNIDTVILQSHS